MMHCTPEFLLAAVRKTYPNALTVGSNALAEKLGAVVDNVAYYEHPCQLVQIAANAGHPTVELSVFTPHRVYTHVFTTGDLVYIGPPAPARIEWHPVQEAEKWPAGTRILYTKNKGGIRSTVLGHGDTPMKLFKHQGWTRFAVVSNTHDLAA